MSSFAEIVDAQLTQPVRALCELFANEEAHDELTFFSGILNMLSDGSDEEMILAATIELSKCAFLGFSYSPQAKQQIDDLLDNAINLAHTMSASNLN